MEIYKETIIELIDQYFAYRKEYKEISIHTKEAYQRDLEHFFKFVIDHNITELSFITETFIHSYLLNLSKERKAPITINRHITALRSFFLYCFRRGLILTDPMERIPMLPCIKEKKEKRSEEDIEKMMKAIPRLTQKGERDFLMILLLIETKLFVEQLICLRAEDINIKYRYLKITNKGKESVISVNQTTVEQIEHYKEKYHISEKDYLFPARNGQPMTRQAFLKRIKEYVKEAKLENELTLQQIRCFSVKH